MELPKFLIADNSSLRNVIFVIHTEYPRFIINISNDEVHWLEDFDKNDEEILYSESEKLINEAFNFYDKEIDLI
ncbi:hypothetical protein DEJ39_08260 [Bacteroidetes bacterium SCGC AAA795-G10]|nr:hypothetical protein DEJ39_08260 [Bacteroidetes bacterium SCGC AAA795-G10]